MLRSHYKRLIALAAAGSLCACQTVKIPDFDFVKSIGDGYDEAASIGETPELTLQAETPTDLRSAQEWDAQARALTYKRDANAIQDSEFTPKTDMQLAQEAAALKARVQAYKADDPVGGF